MGAVSLAWPTDRGRGAGSAAAGEEIEGGSGVRRLLCRVSDRGRSEGGHAALAAPPEASRPAPAQIPRLIVHPAAAAADREGALGPLPLWPVVIKDEKQVTPS